MRPFMQEIYYKLTASVIRAHIAKGTSEIFSFDCSNSEGAILVLPHGGSRHDIIALRKLQLQARRHGKVWDQYAREIRSRGDYMNGALCLLTGVDKAKSWANAAFSGVSRSFGISLQVQPPKVDESHVTINYLWDRGTPAEVCWGPNSVTPTTDWVENQCIFIRGFRISIRRTAERFLLSESVRILDLASPPAMSLSSKLRSLRNAFRGTSLTSGQPRLNTMGANNKQTVLAFTDKDYDVLQDLVPASQVCANLVFFMQQ